MPPYIGSLGTLFYQSDDGEFVPLTKVHEITFADTEKNYDHTAFINQSDMSMTLTMTARSIRRLRKQIHAWLNGQKRSVRNMKRRKEKTRRARLKKTAEEKR